MNSLPNWILINISSFLGVVSRARLRSASSRLFRCLPQEVGLETPMSFDTFQEKMTLACHEYDSELFSLLQKRGEALFLGDQVFWNAWLGLENISQLRFFESMQGAREFIQQNKLFFLLRNPEICSYVRTNYHI
jgi:hypothetical protein